MSADRSAGDQLIELSKLCELLGMEQSNTVEAHFAEAAALARELFPPNAKPLVWTWIAERWNIPGRWKSGDYSISENGVFFRSAKLDFPWHERDDFEAAMAFCESHHQSRFKELLA